MVLRALEVTDELGRDSLRRGDVSAFVRLCACGADLREFCVCALLAETRRCRASVEQGQTPASVPTG